MQASDVPDCSVSRLRDYLATHQRLPAGFLDALCSDTRAGVRALGVRVRKQRKADRAERARMQRLLETEKRLHERGLTHIAGVDEAGRGPLAGPVVTAAVILPEDVVIAGLNDSKALKPDHREALYDEITSRAVAWAVGRAEPDEIDSINILHATMMAMRRAVMGLRVAPDRVLVDGNRSPESPYRELAIVEGDARAHCIAAASIIAKVTRDREMVALDRQFPGYGFAAHKGYSCPEHFAAIEKLGPSPIHRRSFAPVGNAQPGPPKALTDFEDQIRNALDPDEIDRLVAAVAASHTRREDLARLEEAAAGRRGELQRVGGRGETMAVSTLARAGYEILERNYRNAGGEIDIIARKEGEVAFVEVKTATSTAYGGPEGWVPPGKQRQIARVARAWLHENALHDCSARFDVIAIELLSGALPAIRHFRAAFTADV